MPSLKPDRGAALRCCVSCVGGPSVTRKEGARRTIIRDCQGKPFFPGPGYVAHVPCIYAHPAQTQGRVCALVSHTHTHTHKRSSASGARSLAAGTFLRCAAGTPAHEQGSRGPGARRGYVGRTKSKTRGWHRPGPHHTALQCSEEANRARPGPALIRDPEGGDREGGAGVVLRRRVASSRSGLFARSSCACAGSRAPLIGERERSAARMQPETASLGGHIAGRPTGAGNADGTDRLEGRAGDACPASVHAQLTGKGTNKTQKTLFSPPISARRQCFDGWTTRQGCRGENKDPRGCGQALLLHNEGTAPLMGVKEAVEQIYARLAAARPPSAQEAHDSNLVN